MQLGGVYTSRGRKEGSSYTFEKVETVFTAGICHENATMENLLCGDWRVVQGPRRDPFQRVIRGRHSLRMQLMPLPPNWIQAINTM